MASLRRTAQLLLLAAIAVIFYGIGRSLALRGHRSPMASVRLLARPFSALASRDGVGEGGGGETRISIPPARIFEDVVDHVEREYVQTPPGGGLGLSGAALSRMLASLDDPHTLYLDPTLCRARRDALGGRWQGIGAMLAVRQSLRGDVTYRHLTVQSVAPGSPAERIGLRPGDRINEVDNRWIVTHAARDDYRRLSRQTDDEAALEQGARRITERFQQGLNLPTALRKLIAGQDRIVRLTVERPGQSAPLRLECRTALTEVPCVEFRLLEGEIGVLRVRQFNLYAVRRLRELLADSTKMRGLIVDLRGNSGGAESSPETNLDALSATREMLGLLTNGGTAGEVTRRGGRREAVVVKAGSGRRLPLVALVDGGTANVAELAADALRALGRARVIGVPTFGDSVLTCFAPLESGAGVEITSGALRTARGESLARGVTPDVLFSAPGDDAWFARAMTALPARN